MHTLAMDIQDTRRQRLRQLIADRFDNVVERLSEATDRQNSYYSRVLLKQKGFGERLARDIESKIGLPTGWLDNAGNARVAEDQEAYRVSETSRLTAIYRALGERDRALMLTIAELLQDFSHPPDKVTNKKRDRINAPRHAVSRKRTQEKP